MRVVSVKRTELGCAGHFIVASECRWRRHTQVGDYRVSTVGDYYYKEERKTLGAGENAYFETMVFGTSSQPDPDSDGCGCMAVEDWSELDGQRYATAGRAQAGHEAMVAKYAAMQEDAS